MSEFSAGQAQALGSAIGGVGQLAVGIMGALNQRELERRTQKELEDAMNEKSVADMSRANALKGLFRMVTPYLTMKNVPLLAVNHTYKEIGLFPRDGVGGGTGIYYSADNIWIIGRQQVKAGTEVSGYNFVIKVE